PEHARRLEEEVAVRCMMAPEPGTQLARAVGVADFGNARDRQVLDEYVRRLQDERGWRCQPGAGEDESDGTTVAVAEEDGSMDVEYLEEPREHFESFVVHEARR